MTFAFRKIPKGSTASSGTDARTRRFMSNLSLGGGETDLIAELFDGQSVVIKVADDSITEMLKIVFSDTGSYPGQTLATFGWNATYACPYFAVVDPATNLATFATYPAGGTFWDYLMQAVVNGGNLTQTTAFYTWTPVAGHNVNLDANLYGTVYPGEWIFVQSLSTARPWTITALNGATINGAGSYSATQPLSCVKLTHLSAHSWVAVECASPGGYTLYPLGIHLDDYSAPNYAIDFGTGSDAWMYYNGTNLVIDPDVVGVGQLVVDGTVNASALVGPRHRTIATTAVSAGCTTATDEVICTGAGAIAITLLAATGSGREVTIKNYTGGLVTVTPQALELVDGSPSLVLYPKECVTVVDGGTNNWYINTWETHLNYADNEIVTFGTGADCEMYYDGTDFWINPDVVGTGYVKIHGHLFFPDNGTVILGTGSDALIWYDGTNLNIDPRAVGTGALVIGSGAAGVDYALGFNGETNDGVLQWYEDEDFFAFGDDVLLPDNEKLIFGSAADCDIVYDGTDLLITTDRVAASDIVIDCGTDKTIELTETVWDDLLVPMTAVRLGGSKDPGFTVFKTDGAGSQGVFAWWFDPTAQEELYFAAQLPHTWKEGTTIYPHVHWTPDTTSDGNPANQKVRWGLEYTVAKPGNSFGNTAFVYGTDHTPADADVTADKHYITPLSTITMTNNTLSSILVCRVFRDATNAADNYEHDAGFLAIDFHHEIDTIGSRQEYTK